MMLLAMRLREPEADAVGRVDDTTLEGDQMDRPVVEADDGAHECLPGLASFFQV